MSTSSTASSSSASPSHRRASSVDGPSSNPDDDRAARRRRLSSSGSGGQPKPLRRSDTLGQLAAILSDDYIGESKPLLLAVPVAVAVSLVPRVPAALVFLLNGAAMVPLAALNILIVLTLTKNARAWGGLFRAIGGNSTEFIISAVALTYGESALVQQTMIGIIVNYALLVRENPHRRVPTNDITNGITHTKGMQVLGGSFLHASYGKKDAVFSKSRTSIMSSLVMVTSFCLVIPTVMSLTTSAEGLDSPEAIDRGILNLSHMTATALVLLFFTYLSFRFVTHGQFFPVNPGAAQFNPDSRTNTQLGPKPPAAAAAVGPSALGVGLLGSLGCTVVCAAFLLRSMDAAAQSLRITKTFIAFVVLPLLVSSAKSVSIIRHARPEEAGGSTYMSRLDFAIRSVMTNVLDTLLFNIPLLVFVAWGLNQPMVLVFGLFDAVVFVLSVTIMTFLIRYGKTTYFEGCMLMGTYLSMGIVFFVRPDVAHTIRPTQEFILQGSPQASGL
ncbi:vacuolar calcium ion transporter /H(+) exchanger [Cordyceps fumosorosea ARSEF 2679]|uniref:Vacuolar calcium ion transporter /H(+) exchanger n=1 Tax=Cordyceps fumosorosea (strain ARSEF 2679) TaxID=1081104 RepID=A0A162JTK6_CORFA|nr:vacuolar calcium ion transporter /H(+) exchanger [Cordyceps fumosorosea ARSEF 2679]OAA73602.1 vacuolar calcium ion transporter /H(+) exchanger [Cordyceps fumosorosea ARSEF 2679]